MRKKRLRFNWRTKLLVLLLLFSALPVLVISWWTFQKLDQNFQRATLESLDGLCKTKTQAIEQFAKDRVRQVERISTLLVGDLNRLSDQNASDPAREQENLPELEDRKLLDGESPDSRPAGDTTPVPTEPPPAARESNRQKKAREALGKKLRLILWDQQEYEELMVIDTSGRVVVSTFREHEGKTAENIEYFKSGLKATFVQHVFMSPITENLTMVVAAPIRDGTNMSLGVLAARLNLSNFFRLIGDRTGLGETGETVVGKKLDQEIVFMAPTRYDTEAALTRKIVLGTHLSVPLQEAALGQSGSGDCRDYRDKRCFAAWRHVPSLDWGLVVKIDREEAVLAMTSARTNTVVLALGIFVLLALCAIGVSKSFVSQLRELKDATDQISKGDLNVALSIRSNDEVGDLADSFERMVAAMKFFMEDRKLDREEQE